MFYNYCIYINRANIILFFLFVVASYPISFGTYGNALPAVILAGNSYGFLIYNTAGIEIENMIFVGTFYCQVPFYPCPLLDISFLVFILNNIED